MSTPTEQYIIWLDALERERDELRAKIEWHERRFRETEAEWVDRCQALEAEVERLRAALQGARMDIATKQADVDLIQRTSDRLYQANFLGRAYLGEYVAEVQTLCDEAVRFRAALQGIADKSRSTRRQVLLPLVTRCGTSSS
jgi:chromosome segregation ATPase